MNWTKRKAVMSLIVCLAFGTSLAGQAPASGKLDIPTRYPAAERVVAVGDLHGDLAATRAALRLAGAIDDKDQWIGGKLVVVQTGDQLDRGNDERELLDLLEQLRDQAQAAGGNVHVLNGNHELMNAKLDMRYVTVEGYTDFLETPPADPASPTAQEVVDGVSARIWAMRPGGPYALRFAKRNVIVIVGDTVFVHGGVLPQVVDYGIERLNQETREWLRKDRECPPPVLFPAEGPIWSRDYSDEPDEGDCRMLNEVLDRLGAKRMVVGHTVQEGGIAPACGEKVWLIDAGLSTYYGGHTEVLEIRNDAVRGLKQPGTPGTPSED